MGSGSGGSGVLTCERDGASTRLTCVGCRAPICPRCLVRTPVGMKCNTCGAEPGGAGRRRRRGAAWAAPLALLVLVAGVVALPRLISGAGGGDAGPDSEVLVGGGPRTGPAELARYGRIGSEVRDGDLAFVVVSVDCGASEIAGATTRTAQGKFCVVDLQLRNTGRGPITFAGRAQALVDAQDRRFGPDVAATTAHPRNAGRDLISPVVNPGNTLSGVLVFDVPPEITPSAVALSAGPGRGSFVSLQDRPG